MKSWGPSLHIRDGEPRLHPPNIKLLLALWIFFNNLAQPMWSNWRLVYRNLVRPKETTTVHINELLTTQPAHKRWCAKDLILYYHWRYNFLNNLVRPQVVTNGTYCLQWWWAKVQSLLCGLCKKLHHGALSLSAESALLQKIIIFRALKIRSSALDLSRLNSYHISRRNKVLYYRLKIF